MPATLGIGTFSPSSTRWFGASKLVWGTFLSAAVIAARQMPPASLPPEPSRTVPVDSRIPSIDFLWFW